MSLFWTARRWTLSKDCRSIEWSGQAGSAIAWASSLLSGLLAMHCITALKKYICIYRVAESDRVCELESGAQWIQWNASLLFDFSPRFRYPLSTPSPQSSPTFLGSQHPSGFHDFLEFTFLLLVHSFSCNYNGVATLYTKSLCHIIENPNKIINRLINSISRKIRIFSSPTANVLGWRSLHKKIYV